MQTAPTKPSPFARSNLVIVRKLIYPSHVPQELVKILESGNPAEFMTGQPVHMDGSCNGLQHYAALGRDEEGGRQVGGRACKRNPSINIHPPLITQVNLSAGDKPGDVYSGVCAIVNKKIAEECARVLPMDASEEAIQNHKIAKIVNGLVDRKVVKQTVMTSVYGVTFIGAKAQIKRQLVVRHLQVPIHENLIPRVCRRSWPIPVWRRT